ncbi:hypothetical protein D0Z08_30635 [Nocardioides immobilis]|uniref:Uncharacterized protein n=1 Tax=Nocardioides immobilis TaxID=2049295 RepID=A0A417XS74_9ACTN|nr:hypothetical protein [Nocardioides immobilis]RHW23298.1 hypothetical protein D0Z08_30635 [Nocardioides immobilis]
MVKQAPEDRNLAPEQFPELNRQFYGGSLAPHDYLMQRYRSLFLAVQAPTRLREAFDERLSIGEVHATWSTPDEWDDVALRDYVSAESTVLLHHTAEALFRLYLAHAESPECPWLAVARLRIPSHFKKKVEAFLVDRRSAESAASLMNAFVGHPTPGEDDEKWTAIKDGLVLLMAHLGRRLLDEGPLYNSAKHGLSVLPGAAALAWGDQGGPLSVSADGPSITYLTVADGRRGKRWFQKTVWLNPEQTLVLTSVAIRQLANLWAVAKHRYLDEPWDATQMRWVTADGVKAILQPPSDSGVTVAVPSMGMELLYYLDDVEGS